MTLGALNPGLWREVGFPLPPNPTRPASGSYQEPARFRLRCGLRREFSVFNMCPPSISRAWVTRNTRRWGYLSALTPEFTPAAVFIRRLVYFTPPRLDTATVRHTHFTAVTVNHSTTLNDPVQLPAKSITYALAWTAAPLLHRLRVRRTFTKDAPFGTRPLYLFDFQRLIRAMDHSDRLRPCGRPPKDLSSVPA